MMSRSIFLTTNEIPKTTDLRYRLTTNRSNEPVPIVVQTSATKSSNTSITRNNPRNKRNLKDKRRATGVRPDDILTATASNEVKEFIKKDMYNYQCIRVLRMKMKKRKKIFQHIPLNLMNHLNIIERYEKK